MVKGSAYSYLNSESGKPHMPALAVFSDESVYALGGAVAALWGALVVIFRLLIASKDKEIKMVEDQRDSYKGIAQESVDRLKGAATQHQVLRGITPLPALAPVVPEQHSPVTPVQRETANMQTLRSELTAAALALGQAPRVLTPEGDKPTH
jgi:hypothetical protein